MKTTLLAVLAGILYCSWPLGAWLNPAVSGHKLASQLGGLHQPYNWVFIAGDILCGIACVVLSIQLWRHENRRLKRNILWIIVGGLVVFGVGTALAAAVPVRCETALHSCPSPLHDSQLLVHGIASVVSSVALGCSLLVLYALRLTDWLAGAIFAAYSLSGAVSLTEILSPKSSNVLQHIFLTLTGLCLASLPYMLARVSSLRLGTIKKVETR